jgi:hypothetical protein
VTKRLPKSVRVFKVESFVRNCLKTQDFARETYEIDEKEEEIFLNLSSFSFLSRVSWAEKYFSNSFSA